MHDIHFLRPEFLALLPLLIILFFVQKRRQSLTGQWQNIISPALQKYVLKQNKPSPVQHWLNGTVILCALLSIFALAGPSWQKQSSQVYHNQAGLIIALDLSLSMTAQDVSPSRLKRAKFKITDILQQHQDRAIALMVYAGDAHVVSPLTRDINTIQAMLPVLDPYIMPAPGSNLIKLAEQAVALFEQSNSQPKQLLLITDGVEPADILKATSILNDAQVQLSILAVGTEQGAPIVKPDGSFFKDGQGQVIMPPLELPSLQQLSSAANAPITQLRNNDDDIQYLLKHTLSAQSFSQAQDSEVEFDQWLDSGYWLLIPLMVLSLLAFRRGVILAALVLALPLPQEGWAQETDKPVPSALPDFLLNQDQRALKRFDHKPSEAAAQFTDKKWQASSLYKSGQHEQALGIWQNYQDETSLYNQGNALAQLNRLEEAIAAYNAVLEQNPNHEDAAHNKTILEKLQQQQDQQQNQDQQDGESQQDDQKNGEQKNSEQQGNGEQQQKDAEKNQDQQQGEQQQGENSGSQEQDPDLDSGNEQTQASEQEQSQQEKDLEELARQMNKASESKDGNEQKQPAQPLTQAQQEQQQAMQQWIERIPDDPGGLLRNKFLYQYKNRNQAQQDGDRKPW